MPTCSGTVLSMCVQPVNMLCGAMLHLWSCLLASSCNSGALSTCVPLSEPSYNAISHLCLASHPTYRLQMGAQGGIYLAPQSSCYMCTHSNNSGTTHVTCTMHTVYTYCLIVCHLGWRRHSTHPHVNVTAVLSEK